VSMLVVLFPITKEALALKPAALERLAELGVTNVSLLQDASTSGVVLEGWAFDPTRASEAASVVAGACEDVRTLHPLVQMAVSPARSQQQLGGKTS
jgi:hypothetical protein